MFFKNAQIYRLADEWTISREELDGALSKKVFVAPGSQDFESSGWVNPSEVAGVDSLVYSQGGNYLICLQIEQKILPSAVINQIAEERVVEYAENFGHRPGRRQIREFRELVAAELLPKAFSRKKKIYAMIVPGFIVIDSASVSKAEDLLEKLRLSIDKYFPVKFVQTEISPASSMSSWLADNEPPSGFTIDEDCTLRSVTEERREVAYRRGLAEEQIRENLMRGCLPVKLAMTFDDRISFVLTDKFELKRIKFLDQISEKLESCESEVELFESKFALNAGELKNLIHHVIGALGGEFHQS